MKLVIFLLIFIIKEMKPIFFVVVVMQSKADFGAAPRPILFPF